MGRIKTKEGRRIERKGGNEVEERKYVRKKQE